MSERTPFLAPFSWWESSFTLAMYHPVSHVIHDVISLMTSLYIVNDIIRFKSPTFWPKSNLLTKLVLLMKMFDDSTWTAFVVFCIICILQSVCGLFYVHSCENILSMHVSYLVCAVWFVTIFFQGSILVKRFEFV
jgi:hypothetical protein